MDINFPLILMLATFITGVIVLIDKLYLSKRRRQNDEQDKPEYSELESFLVTQSRSFFPVLAFIFVVRSFLFEPYQIPSASMEPGLIDNDFILVNKFNYGLRLPVFNIELIPIGKPERGDIMVFFPPNDNRNFIKRVIGLPGDVVEYNQDHQLIINGKKVERAYIDDLNTVSTKLKVKETIDNKAFETQWLVNRNANGQLFATSGSKGRWIVPEGHYFMLGDNRGNSHDGRGFGFVPEDRIVGQAVALWMHWPSLTSLPEFSRNKWLQ